MNELIELLALQGKVFIGILKRNSKWCVYAFDPKLAGRKPVFYECRDKIDYKLLLYEWEKRGTYILYVDSDFNAAIHGAIGVVKGS